MVAGTTLGGYNRASISLNIVPYDYNNAFNGGDKENPTFVARGAGLNYIHGFGLSKKLPMFLEVGGNINYNTHTWSEKQSSNINLTQFSNLNIRIPLNFAWKFQLDYISSITPYAGINFKFNCMTQYREGFKLRGKAEWLHWVSLLKKSEKLDDANVWNVFQVGWQVGANYNLSRFYIGLEVGYDFLPVYDHTVRIYDIKEVYKINTILTKLHFGYSF